MAQLIAYEQIRLDPIAWQKAHSLAATYFARHFQGQQIVKSLEQTENFLEARHHLAAAGDEDRLAEIGNRYLGELKGRFTGVTPPPKNAAELNEQIALLSALLREQGPKTLHYYLTRVLRERGEQKDKIAALKQIRLACGPEAPAPTWVLRLRLENEQGEEQSFRGALAQAVISVRADQNLFSIYQTAGEIFAQNGKADEAVQLLKQGIQRIPANQSAFSLYIILASVFSRKEQYAEAVGILEEGHSKIPSHHNGYKLTESLAMIALAHRDEVQLKKISANGGLYQRHLAKVLLLELQGDFTGAAAAAREGRKEASNYLPLVIREAFSELSADQPERACRALMMTQSFRYEAGTAVTWLRAAIEVRSGNLPKARYYLELYLGRALAVIEEPGYPFLLLEWKKSMERLSGPTPAFFFPHLPSWLEHLATCAPLQVGRIPAPISEAPADKKAILLVATEWSSQQGGVSTVNRELAIALAGEGHPVFCLVPSTNEREKREAEKAGVTLLEVPNLYSRPNLPPEKVGLIIGHDRFTGNEAADQRQRNFPGAMLLQILHTRSEDLEWFKDDRPGRNSAKEAEERRALQAKLAENADLVAGVGPVLTLTAKGLV